ncbi:phenylacetate--CoA ligase family protein [Microbulbifer agarilyticus]
MNPDLWNPVSRLAIDSEELASYQVAELKAYLTDLYDRSPYYREKFDKAGVNPHVLSSMEDFAKYPTFDKYEERESQAQSLVEDGHPLGKHITCDIRDVNRMSASSGTTGTPSFQGHTKHDREVIFKNFARLMDVIGGKPGDKVMMAGVMSMWVAGIPTVDALLDFGANVIPIGGLVGTAKVAEMMQLTRPDIVICTPSFARVLIKKSKTPDIDIDLASLGIKKICVYGEPGGSVPEIIRELEAGFGGAKVFDMSGGTGCLNPIFVSCEEQDGLHFIAPDDAVIELYDRETDTVLPWEDSAIGEFVFTGLNRECGPLIRFKDGDLMQVTTKPCKCGFPGMRVKFIGRVDDMLLVKGVNVFPTAIRDLVTSFESLTTGNIRVVKPSDSPVVEPPLRVKVESTSGLTETELHQLKSEIELKIQRVLRFKADVSMFEEGELPTEYGATGKFKILENAF